MHLLIVDHEHKEKIQIIIRRRSQAIARNARPSETLMPIYSIRPKECGEVGNRRLCNEVTGHKDQKHMERSVWSRLGQVIQD